MSRCDRGGSLLLFTLAFFPPIAAIHRFVVEPCHGSVVSLPTTRILIQFQIHTIHWSPSFFEIFQKWRKTFGYAHVYLYRNDGSWIYYRCIVIEWSYINKCFFFLVSLYVESCSFIEISKVLFHCVSVFAQGPYEIQWLVVFIIERTSMQINVRSW